MKKILNTQSFSQKTIKSKIHLFLSTFKKSSSRIPLTHYQRRTQILSLPDLKSSYVKFLPLILPLVAALILSSNKAEAFNQNSMGDSQESLQVFNFNSGVLNSFHAQGNFENGFAIIDTVSNRVLLTLNNSVSFAFPIESIQKTGCGQKKVIAKTTDHLLIHSIEINDNSQMICRILMPYKAQFIWKTFSVETQQSIAETKLFSLHQERLPARQ